MDTDDAPDPLAAQCVATLREIRQEARLNQDVVAEALGLTVSAVSRLERGVRALPLSRLARWAGALGLRVEVVLFPAEGPPLEDYDRATLEELASLLPHMPGPAQRALCSMAHAWRLMGGAAAPPDSATVPSDLERDATRYRRLRLLGAAPCDSAALEGGTVLRFQSLDGFVDADIEAHASRGEFRHGR